MTLTRYDDRGASLADPDVLISATRSEDAEADLLCAVLVSSGRALDELDLAAAEFYRPANEIIYAAALRMHADGQPVEPTTLVDHLQASGELAAIGGFVGISDLLRRQAVPASATHYARIIRRHAARRALIAAGGRLQQLGLEASDDPGEAIEVARGFLDQASERISGRTETDLSDDLDAAIDAIEHGSASLATPWDDLNDLVGGWRKGAVYVVAARPGGGKSIIGVQALLDAMIRHGVPTAMSSMEMTKTEIHQRAFSQLGPVNLAHIVRGGSSLGVDEWQRIAEARGKMGDLKFVVDDRSSSTLADIRANITRCVRRYGSCGLYVVDYLQQMTSSGRVESRQTEVASFSRGLKIIAKDFEVPMILLAQLNRGPDSEKRPPRVSDLRESGAIEADADVVMLLHRDEENHPETLHVNLGKNRHGPKDAIELGWEGNYSRVMGAQWTPHRAVGGQP